MKNNFKMLKVQDYRTKPHASTIGSMKYFLDNNEFDLDPHYQREYVWGIKEQEEFLYNLLNEFPLGTIVVVIDESKDEQFMEVVDGKQRLTTLKLFFNNEIPYNGYMWDDLDVIEQRNIKNLKIPMEVLYMVDGSDVPEDVKLKMFFNVNFTGLPQSKEHMERILKLMEETC